MSLLVPSFLIALLSIGIPILIHLFYFQRYKKVEFTNVHFLKVLKEEATSRSKLRNLLILMTRILAVGFLVLAFCQPYFNQDQEISSDKSIVSIYIDNSFSMNNESSSGPLLDEAKVVAKEIINQFPVSASFQILSNEFLQSQQQFLDRTAALDQVSSIKVVPESRKYQSIIARQSNALKKENSSNKSMFVISDFQGSMGNLEQIYIDSSIQTNWIRLEGNQIKNISIDSLWFSNPFIDVNQPIELVVAFSQINNTYEGELNVSLQINDEKKAISTIQMNDQNRLIDTLVFTINETGSFFGEVNIDDYPIQFDNNFYFSFQISDAINVLDIKQQKSPSYIGDILDGHSYIKYQSSNVQQLDYSTMNSYDVIVLNEIDLISSGLKDVFTNFVAKGGVGILIPSPSIDLNSYNDMRAILGVPLYQSVVKDTIRIGAINYQTAVLQNVFEGYNDKISMPQVFEYYPLGAGGEDILSMSNQGNCLLANQVEDGVCYQFAMSLDPSKTDLTRHALFVPLIYNMVVKSKMNKQLAYIIGEDDFVETSLNETSSQLVKVFSNNFEIRPEVKSFNNKSLLVLANQIKEPGYYNVTQGEDLVDLLAFNYKRTESDLSFYSEELLTDVSELKGVKLSSVQLDGENSVDIDFTNDSMLWKLCIIFVLLALAAEMILIKRR